MQVGAEVGWAAVTTVTGHCSGTDLYHIRRTGLETFNMGVASLGSHGMGNGLTLILQRQRQTVMSSTPKKQPHVSKSSSPRPLHIHLTMQARGKPNREKSR